MRTLASTCQDGGNPFPVIRLPVVNSVTDSSRHTLLLPALHSQWSRQVYIIHQSITGFLVVQEPTCTHAHEYRLLGASCFVFICCYKLNSPHYVMSGPGLFSLRAFPTFRSHDFRHGCLYIESSEGGREGLKRFVTVAA